MKTLLTTIVAVTLISGTAYAGNNAAQEQFNKLDTNADGYLSRTEIQAQPILIRFTNFYDQDSFRWADANKDERVSFEEYIAHEEEIPAE